MRHQSWDGTGPKVPLISRSDGLDTTTPATSNHRIQCILSFSLTFHTTTNWYSHKLVFSQIGLSHKLVFPEIGIPQKLVFPTNWYSHRLVFSQIGIPTDWYSHKLVFPQIGIPTNSYVHFPVYLPILTSSSSMNKIRQKKSHPVYDVIFLYR